ncbi:MAG: signal peptide peptidase SppA [Muribaculaceae bacterium]|nr:signal peptide peptidase SppA [Muribaculaceae bacterium]
MKRFFISFLGSLTAIWVSVILLGIGIFVTMMMMIASMASGTGAVQVKPNSVFCLDLGISVCEYPQSMSLMDHLYSRDFTENVVLGDIVEAIDRASKDEDIKGMYIKCGDGISAGMTQIAVISDAVKRFRKAGKWVYAYGDDIAQSDYVIACEADSIFMNPQGSVNIHGLGSSTMYYKGLMDKLDVTMQIAKVGTYKSAVEPYMVTEPSEASKEQQTLFLGNMWKVIKDRIITARNVDSTAVDNWANSFSIMNDKAWFLSEKIVDAEIYRHQMEDKLKAKVKCKKEDDINFVSPSDYLASGRNVPEKGKARIAVYYAEGEINDSGESGIVGDKVCKDILKLAEEKEIDALVLRVNSPGGSAFASEQIWEALEQFKTLTGKPFYVSMSDYAASGGYYISCGADRIYADPLTLTGSIGIFGMLPNASGLLKNKLGVNVVSVATNPEGVMPSLFQGLTPYQMEAFQKNVERGYELFVSRVAKGRGMTVDAVKAVAEGRVWDGKEALGKGLVDKIGNLDAVLTDLAAELKVKDYEVKKYPEVEQDFWSQMLKIGSNVKMHIIEDELGDNFELWYMLQRLQNMAPIQARMDYITVK